MNCIENGINKTNGSSTQTYKSFPIHYGLWEEDFLKRILMRSCITKCSEINMCHSDIQ